MATRAALRLLPLATLVGLAACSGSGSMPESFSVRSEGEGPEYGAELFAYPLGSWYYYVHDRSPNLPEVAVEVVKSVYPASGGTVIELDNVNALNSQLGLNAGKSYFVDEHGVFLLGPHHYRGQQYSEGECDEWLDPPVVLLAFPLKGGKSWVSESGHLRLQVTVLGVETVTVPAGTYECVKIETLNPDMETKTYDQISAGTWWWFAAGVGLVKRTHGTTYYQPPSGGEDDIVWELWRIEE
jgi:hypothetical protein